jgi:hypothetical protein
VDDAGGAQGAAGAAHGDGTPLPPLSCTDWTRLVLLPVLTGRVSSFSQARERDAHKAEVARRGAEAAGAHGELEAACEELRARCEALARDNAQLTSVVAAAGGPAAPAANAPAPAPVASAAPAANANAPAPASSSAAPAAAPAWGRGWTS